MQIQFNQKVFMFINKLNNLQKNQLLKKLNYLLLFFSGRREEKRRSLPQRRSWRNFDALRAAPSQRMCPFIFTINSDVPFNQKKYGRKFEPEAVDLLFIYQRRNLGNCHARESFEIVSQTWRRDLIVSVTQFFESVGRFILEFFRQRIGCRIGMKVVEGSRLVSTLYTRSDQEATPVKLYPLHEKDHFS
ncbi:unnamed protein product [Paramecium pentaurelia]|uniref:Uncharacterized protein n=1 Tax=Paramecium pentaurelia TaxID=43138 RepID=A0A8S1YBD4_9CILI|nr:unnamed protein product [Paramecium pentaurelia]